MLGHSIQLIDGGAEAQPYRGPSQASDEKPGPLHWPGGIASSGNIGSPLEEKYRTLGRKIVYLTFFGIVAVIILLAIIAPGWFGHIFGGS
jgi:hypothetical protein